MSSMAAGYPHKITLAGAVKSIAAHRGCEGWCMTDEEWAMELLEDVIENEADGSRDEREGMPLPHVPGQGGNMSH